MRSPPLNLPAVLCPPLLYHKFLVYAPSDTLTLWPTAAEAEIYFVSVLARTAPKMLQKKQDKIKQEGGGDVYVNLQHLPVCARICL